MSNITYLRKFNTTFVDKIFLFSLIKKIVTFYYDTFIFHQNIFKKYENMSINNLEHKNCLAFLKAAKDSSINYIY